jgi:Holliday junction DNA helicase RuvA
MIDSLAGTLVSKTPGTAVVEVGGIGFEVSVPLSTFSVLPDTGKPLRLLTHLQVSQENVRLFGFATEAERRLFRVLMRVHMMGPTRAMHVLSSCNVQDFTNYVMAGDVKALSTLVKGVGKKTAQRLILELRGELAEEDAQVALAVDNPAASDVIKALISLGTSPSDARKSVEAALKKLGPDADEQSLMREALSS